MTEVRAESVQELVRRVEAASFRGGSRRAFTDCLCLACLAPVVVVEATVDWVTWILRHGHRPETVHLQAFQDRGVPITSSIASESEAS